MAEERRRVLLRWDDEHEHFVAWVPGDLRLIMYPSEPCGSGETWLVEGFETREWGVRLIGDQGLVYVEDFEASGLDVLLRREVNARERRADELLEALEFGPLSAVTWPG